MYSFMANNSKQPLDLAGSGSGGLENHRDLKLKNTKMIAHVYK